MTDIINGADSTKSIQRFEKGIVADFKDDNEVNGTDLPENMTGKESLVKARKQYFDEFVTPSSLKNNVTKRLNTELGRYVKDMFQRDMNDNGKLDLSSLPKGISQEGTFRQASPILNGLGVDKAFKAIKNISQAWKAAL